MPELPEVETIKRILEKEVVGLSIDKCVVLYPRLIQTDLNDFKKDIVGKKIVSLSRAGKYLIFHLSSNLALIVHFRMEGKFFHLPELEPNLNKHVSLYFEMSDKTYMIFNDVRKFGVMYLEEDKDLMNKKPLSELGKEPWDISSPSYLLDKYHNKTYMMKEALLDQSVITGLGNIYADETLFACGISPFKKAKDLTKEEAEKVIIESSRILKEAIENHGSTIRTYHPAQGMSGGMQDNLKMYGKEGKKCPICHTTILKRYVGGRGTCFCSKCQHVMPSIAICGKIAVGKSEVLKMFEDLGCYVASADDMVHQMYVDGAFLKALAVKFPEVFEDGQLNKSLVMQHMDADKKFRRKYELFIWSKVKDIVNDFLINHTDKIAVIEVPLLFDAKMESSFLYTIGVESNKQREYLENRSSNNIDQRLKINKKNAYDLNRNKLSFIIQNDGTRENLLSQVKAIFARVSF